MLSAAGASRLKPRKTTVLSGYDVLAITCRKYGMPILYVYENYGKTDYSIKRRIALNDNNLANTVVKEINNGTYGTAKAFDTWHESLQTRTRRYNSRLNDAGHGRKTVGSGRLSKNSGTQSTKSAGGIQRDSGDSHVKKKFSMEVPVEEKKNLIALHNLDETNIRG